MDHGSLYCKTKQTSDDRFTHLGVSLSPRVFGFTFFNLKILHTEPLLSQAVELLSLCTSHLRPGLQGFLPSICSYYLLLLNAEVIPSPPKETAPSSSSFSVSRHCQDWTFPTPSMTFISIYWIGMNKLEIIFKALISSNLTPPLSSYILHLRLPAFPPKHNSYFPTSHHLHSPSFCHCLLTYLQ